MQIIPILYVFIHHYSCLPSTKLGKKYERSQIPWQIKVQIGSTTYPWRIKFASAARLREWLMALSRGCSSRPSPDTSREMSGSDELSPKLLASTVISTLSCKGKSDSVHDPKLIIF